MGSPCAAGATECSILWCCCVCGCPQSQGINASASNVQVNSISPGSVVASITLIFPSGATNTAASAASVVTSSPSTVFSQSFLNTYGISGTPSVTIVYYPPPPTSYYSSSSSSSGLSKGAIAGIAVGASVGGLLIIGLLVFIVVKAFAAPPPSGKVAPMSA